MQSDDCSNEGSAGISQKKGKELMEHGYEGECGRVAEREGGV